MCICAGSIDHFSHDCFDCGGYAYQMRRTMHGTTHDHTDANLVGIPKRRSRRSRNNSEAF